jgi:hypothetical protein
LLADILPILRVRPGDCVIFERHNNNCVRIKKARFNTTRYLGSSRVSSGSKITLIASVISLISTTPGGHIIFEKDEKENIVIRNMRESIPSH